MQNVCSKSKSYSGCKGSKFRGNLERKQAMVFEYVEIVHVPGVRCMKFDANRFDDYPE